MKLWPKFLLAFLLLTSLPLAADNTGDANPADNLTGLTTAPLNPNTDNTPQGDLVQYLLRLGAYLGFDLTQDPKTLTPPLVYTLIALADIQLATTPLANAFLGALTVNSLSTDVFLPKRVPGADAANPLANNTFKTYNAPGDGNNITANPLVDQPNLSSKNLFQSDPVNQTTTNLLGTPDVSFCGSDGMNSISQPGLDKCTLIYRTKILNNLIGKIPSFNAVATEAFYSPAYVQGLLSQLNSNSLLGPLRYSTSGSSSSDDSAAVDIGLQAASQASQAANFIRYASGTVVPPQLLSYDKYKDVYLQATQDTAADADAATLTQKLNAQSKLYTYFAGLRIYAARASVGVSNLYYLLSKRMEQTVAQNSGGKSQTITLSQAQYEYNMATRRLSGDSTWLENINSASSATVQKEIAVLLAEINYQLYLNRQQEERMLLTQSMIQLQNTTPPATDLDQGSAPPANLPTQ